MTSAYDQGQIPAIQLKHRLQIAREHAGYEREQLAAIMEVSRNTVGNAESGRTQPRKIMLNAWALACGVPVTWLLTGHAPPSPPEDPLPRMDSNHQPPDSVTRLRQPHRHLPKSA